MRQSIIHSFFHHLVFGALLNLVPRGCSSAASPRPGLVLWTIYSLWRFSILPVYPESSNRCVTEWRYSSGFLAMRTEIWFAYNFYVTANYSSFGVFFQSFKNVKTIPNLQEVWRVRPCLLTRLSSADSCPRFTYTDNQAKPKKTSLCVCVCVCD